RPSLSSHFLFFFFPDTTPSSTSTLSLHDALPIFFTLREFLDNFVHRHRRWFVDDMRGWLARPGGRLSRWPGSRYRTRRRCRQWRSEEHTSELQSRGHLVCRLLLEKKKECMQWKQA